MSDTINPRSWATWKKVAVIIGAGSAALLPFLPDSVPGSPRSIVMGIGLAAVAVAAAI